MVGWVEIAAGDVWNLFAQAAGEGRYWLVSPAVGTSALALVRCNLYASVHASGQTRACSCLVWNTTTTTTTSVFRRSTFVSAAGRH